MARYLMAICVFTFIQPKSDSAAAVVSPILPCDASVPLIEALERAVLGTISGP